MLNFRSASDFRSSTGSSSPATRTCAAILMWDGFEDHPMRRDYVDPDDFEYEPTPHDEVLKRAEEHEKAEASA